MMLLDVGSHIIYTCEKFPPGSYWLLVPSPDTTVYGHPGTSTAPNTLSRPRPEKVEKEVEGRVGVTKKMDRGKRRPSTGSTGTDMGTTTIVTRLPPRRPHHVGIVLRPVTPSFSSFRTSRQGLSTGTLCSK